MCRNRVPFLSGLLVGAVISVAGAPGIAQAQDTSAPKPAESQTAPTTPPSPAPAAGPGKETASVPAVQATNKKKTKKVWTNEELKSVKSGISVVGDSDKGDGYTYTREDNQDKDSLHQQQVEEYRNQIRDLRDRIAAVDKRIAQLKDFKAENSSASGGINIHQGYNMVPVADQVKELGAAKKQLQAQIEDIENEARKIGIQPGELR